MEKPYKLSLKTALALFDIKLSPTASYGVPLIWEQLTSSQLARLDRVKPAFLKRALGLHASTKNRLVYLLCDTPLFVEDLRKRFRLTDTAAYCQFINQYEVKMAEVDPDFFKTGAMRDDTWKGHSRTNRHVVVRYAVHGYHHRLCRTAHFHEPDEDCRCSRCEAHCGRYHADQCPAVTSLNELARHQ
jgi:hypothetical protein